MNFLDLTPGSTHATNVAIQLYMPPAEAKQMLDICDKMQALEAAQPAPGELEHLRAEVQRLTPNPEHARKCRTQGIEALVLLALENATLRADLLAVTYSFRVTKVIDHLRKYKDRYAIEFKDRYGIAKPPTPSRVKIHAIMTQHGYML